MKKMLFLVSLVLLLTGCDGGETYVSSNDEELLASIVDTITLDGVTYHRPLLGSEADGADEYYEDFLGTWALYTYENGRNYCESKNLFLPSRRQVERLYEEYNSDNKGRLSETVMWPTVMYYRTGSLSDDPTYHHYHISFYSGEGMYQNPDDVPNHIMCVDYDDTDGDKSPLVTEVTPPTTSHNSGNYNSPFYLELIGDGKIIYSVNASDPYVEYTEPILIDKNTTVKAKVELNGVSSEIKTWDYTINNDEKDQEDVGTVRSKITYSGRILYRPLLVEEVKGIDVETSMTDSIHGLDYALLNYYDATSACENIGGSLPSDLYLLSDAWNTAGNGGGDGINSGGFAVINEELYNYLGWMQGPIWQQSGFGYEIYLGMPADWYDEYGPEKDQLYYVSCTIEPKPSKSSGTYDDNILVDFNVKGNIYYTLDGSEPTEASLVYNEAIAVGKSAVLKVMIVNDDGSVTRLEDYIYEIKPNVPFANNEAGEYDTGVDITLTGEGDIFYTVDGSTPTPKSNKYTMPIPITSNTILKAIVYDGSLSSDVFTWEYTIK